MEEERAPKRARSGEPVAGPAACAAAAAGQSLAAEAEADGSGQAGASSANHFARLPDELVLRIFSELEAMEAYETCRLWSLDRRFARLSRAVQWQLLSVELKLNQYPTGDAGLSLQRMNEFKKLLNRVTARVRSGALAGCRALAVGSWCTCNCAGAQTLLAMRAHAVALRSEEGVEASIGAAFSMTEVLEALAGAPCAPERVSFSFNQALFPSEEVQRALGVAAPKSLDDVARAFQAALRARAAPISSLHLPVKEVLSALLAGAVPECLRRLQELHSCAPLDAKQTSRMVEVWPGLKKIECGVSDGAALRELSKLALEELRLSMDSSSETSGGLELEEALASINPGCVRALRYSAGRRIEPISPGVLSSSLRFRGLEELEMTVDRASTAIVGGLAIAPLRKLHSLMLTVAVSTPVGIDCDRGAELLEAAAAALAAAPALRSVRLNVVNHFAELRPVDTAGLVSLIHATRSSLHGLLIQGVPAAKEVLQAVLACPKLDEVALLYYASRDDHEDDAVDKLRAFSELANFANERAPVCVQIHIPDSQREKARAMFRGWFSCRRENGIDVRYFRIRINNEIIDI